MAEVLAFDPHRARQFLHTLRGRAHRFAWRYYRWRIGKGRRPRSNVLPAETERIIIDAVDVGLGKRASTVAPAVFAGWQERPGGKPPVALYKLTAAVPGHPERSHVSAPTLIKLGFDLPETPAPNPREPGLIWGRSSRRRQSNPVRIVRRSNPDGAPRPILDFITEAVHRELRGERDGWSWVFFHEMSANDHLRFDLWLVKMGDPLASEAGTPENRFRRRVMAMVNAERTRRGGNPGMSAAARRKYPGVAQLQKDVAAVYRLALQHYAGDAAKARQTVESYLSGRAAGERAPRGRGYRQNPPPRGGGARLIYPAGRIVGSWYGRHRNGEHYRHRFGRGLKSVYGLPNGDLILSAHQGRLWKTFH